MAKFSGILWISLSTVSLIGASLQAASAQTAPGLGDLVGARGSSAESALAERGYEAAGNMGAASLWWRASSKTCVSMLVEDGRVQSIESGAASLCGKSGARQGRISGACPADVSEADRYKYPACDNPGAARAENGAKGCPPDVSEADRYRYPACKNE